MLIHSFSKKMVKSGIFDTYVATVFFAMLVFFVLNMNSFTPIEILIGVMIATITFKGIANIMFAMTISFVTFDKLDDAMEFEKAAEHVEALANELSIKQVSLKKAKHKSE